MNELHEEVLAPATARVFARLGGQPELGGFYLAGGTGAALQMGHRVSEDLDLFTERPWRWETIDRALAACGRLVVDRQEPGTFVGSVDAVRVSLFHYAHTLLEEPIPSGRGLLVAGLLDIGCMKLVALAQRGSRKDFVDVYHLGQAGIPVRDLVRGLRRKMPGTEYNLVHLLRGLAYFEEAEGEPDPVMLAPYDWRVVREYCANQAMTLLDEITG